MFLLPICINQSIRYLHLYRSLYCNRQVAVGLAIFLSAPLCFLWTHFVYYVRGILMSVFTRLLVFRRCKDTGFLCQSNGRLEMTDRRKRPEMTAARVSEQRLRRQSSVLSHWRVPWARCI